MRNTAALACINVSTAHIFTFHSVDLHRAISPKIPSEIQYVYNMIRPMRLVRSTLLTAFLLVVGHDMIPHWHTEGSSDTPTVSNPFAETHFLTCLVSLNLGADHLENFSKGSSQDLFTLPAALSVPLATVPISGNLFSRKFSLARFDNVSSIPKRGPPQRSQAHS